MKDLIKAVTIDWKWVEAHLSARERLATIGEGSTREAVLGQLKEALDIAKSKAASQMVIVKTKISGFPHKKPNK